MNDDQIHSLARLMRHMLDQIETENRRGQDGQAIVTLDQQAVGRLSRMDALQNQAMAKAQQARREAQARRLRAALARVDTGDYGLCTDCGDDIAQPRLALDPAATLCITCASGG